MALAGRRRRLAGGLTRAERFRKGPVRRRRREAAKAVGMTRFLLDTGSAGDYIHRRRGVYRRAREAVAAGDRVGIGLPVLAELWYGVENSSSREKNAERLRRVLPELIIWPLTEPAAEAYGRIAAELRRTGRPVGKMDMLIAAIALSLGKTTRVSADNHLTAVPGLNGEDWPAP